jgi:asparagine synthase (glutamine-hydrolysing)
MISFEIKWEDIGKPLVQRRKNRWVFGSSYIEVYDHSILESYLIRGDNKLLLVVREKLDNYSFSESIQKDGTQEFEIDKEKYEKIASNAKKWPLEFLLLEVVNIGTNSNNYSISLQTGVWGTAPVYLTSTKESIAGNWDITKLYPFIKADCIDLAQVIYYLSGLEGYSSRTIFKNVKLLTERAKAVFEPTNWHIEYPEPAPEYSPHFLMDDAEVTDIYREILSASLKRWSCHKNSDLVGCELSGGLDSANVTAVAASVCNSPIATYGMILDGEMGKQQQLRRKELIEKFNTLDYTIDAAQIQNHPLFLDGSRMQNRLINPYEETYSEMNQALINKEKANNHKVILTGLGGDELLLPDSFEIDKDKNTKKDKTIFFSRTFFLIPRIMHPLAFLICEEKINTKRDIPKAILPESALNAARHQAPVFLRNGIWPLNPLCTPELIEFCHKLPLRWRAKKYLHRQLLRELSISENTVTPEIKENFVDVMNNAITNTSQSLVKYLLKESYLSEMDLIDKQKANKEYDSVIAGISSSNPGLFYWVSNLELTIRSIRGEKLYANAE